MHHRLRTITHYLAGDRSAVVTPEKLLARARSEPRSRAVYGGALDSAKRFEDIPLLTKAELRNRTKNSLSREKGPLWYKDTSGTTGQPLRVFYAAEFQFQQRFLDIPFIIRRAGVADYQVRLCDRPFCVHLTDTVTSRSEQFLSPIDRHLYANIQLHDRPALNALAEAPPVVLSTRPEILSSLTAESWVSGLKVIVSAGSLLGAERRRAIAGSNTARVIDAYSLSEFGVVASECEAGGLHVDETRIWMEIVDDRGGPASTGEAGEVVLSSLANRAQPLLRYRTGDRGRLIDDCPGCGASAKVVILESTRVVPLFDFPGCERFLPTCFNDLPFRFPVNEYAVVQTGKDQVTVNLFVTRPEGMDGVLIEAISAYSRSKLPANVGVEVVAKPFEPLLKQQRYQIRIVE